jgi:cysteinyl-tRNA synthetase
MLRRAARLFDLRPLATQRSIPPLIHRFPDREAHRLAPRLMASTSASGGSKQPQWTVPAALPGHEEPALKVYNSLTRSKVDFVPIKGRHVTWYNCGPTVYDSSHMGHARNYVTQDIIRRILRDYFGYDIHFVMNITDIDDKIIVRARQSHLLSSLRSHEATVGLSRSLIDFVRASWSAYFQKTLKKLAPKPPPGEPSEPEDEAAWEEICRREQQDAKWVQASIEAEPKFTMWFKALKESHQAIIAATMAQTAGDKSSEAALSLIDASGDPLGSYLDGQKGHTVSDPAVFRQLAAYWEGEYFKDMHRLHVERPTTLTRVSEYVPEIVTFVERIIGNGFAYEDSGPGDGKKNVWFDTRAFDGAEESKVKHSYAKLAPWSKGNKELLEEGEGALSTGASTVAGKRAPSDFALWKSSKPGEPAWDSPWGPGRPGWHIECSVMASEVLGTQIDIHSGGVDLMFPHHDNELAQAEAHHQCQQWINYFLHTGHLHIEGLKMSKSLKNFISIEEAMEKYSARQLRMAFLLQPWSSRMDFKQSAMAEVRNAESSFNNFFAGVRASVREARHRGDSYSDGQHHYGSEEKILMADLAQAQMNFRKAMCDSFDTPNGIAALLDLVSKCNVYERNRGRGAVNVSVLEAVAVYVGKMLRMFGLGEGVVREGSIGWGDAAKQGEPGTNLDREEVLMPYLRALSTFRDSVRSLARNQAPHYELLQLSDQLRNMDMVDLGVALEDQDDGKAVVKLVDAEILQRQRLEKETIAAEKAARKKEVAAKEEAARKEKLEKAKITPEDLFKTADFSEWNEKGVPIKDKEGADVSKGKKKQYEKELEKQKKLHEEYLASLQK